MFHVKRSRRFHRGLLFAALGAIALIAAGCVQIDDVGGWPAPVVTDEGYVITQGGDGTLVAFDPDGGREVWVYPTQLPGGPTGPDDERPDPDAIYATPVVDGDTLYVVTYEGMVTRIDSADGRIESPWFTLIGEQVVATPVLEGGELYIGTEEGHVVAIDTENGDLLQRHPASEGRVWGRPALDNGSLYLSDLDERNTVAFDLGEGARLWEQGLTAASASDLLLDDELLLVGSFDRALHALDVTLEGEERWRFDGDGWFVGPPTIDDDVVYVASMRGSVYALDRDGELLWQHTTEEEEYRASPLLVNGTVVVASRDGLMLGLDAENGAELWRQSVEGAEINAHGLLLESGVFYATTDYELLRLDPESGAVERFSVAR